MMKRACKQAITPALGVVAGNVIWRATHPYLYNETWPPMQIHALYQFAIMYVVCAAVYLLVDWIRLKTKSDS